MAKQNQQFQTIRTEGAILPPDILRRIASLKVEGATPDAYHLAPGSKINEAISQSWTALLSHWQGFQEAFAELPESEQTATAVTNDRWLLPLFKELGFGRLLTAKSPEIEERVYPIERFYNHTPIHLIGCKLPLGSRTKGARGAATASPHSMVQEFLNRSEEHLWAFLSNGLQLRILRDNISLSRQAFVEFDLQSMMEGEVYADFALLWLLCHQSRVESDKPADCWLEQWSKLARDQGTRVLNDLRLGVAKAIEALGRGFIGHPRNDQLRDKLRTGSLSKDDFYRQLLRTVYRLLFLFVAEDRGLLHAPDSSAEACTLYDMYYSTRRLRELAHKIRGSKHADLWHSLSLVFDALSRNKGCPELGLSGLGSFLWRSSSTADLRGPGQPLTGQENAEESDPALITNDDLLQAVRALAFVEQDKMLRIVDYRNLGSEELGSVYESLLELHPVMNAEAKAFELSTAAGNERKTTGSYYTPDSLVQCLLDSALDPVVNERLRKKKGKEAEQAILDMKVCDPACGSGHFLIAAAHRLARHLARVRTGETEPSPEDYQHALRDIIGHCVYGVDLNPMAVELCKVSLWMEAIEPGKPLSFIDHHIQNGNSLLGTTPALLGEGIPDDAFKPIEGDVKDRVNDLKKDNKRQRQDYKSKQGYLFAPMITLGNLPATFSQIDVASEESVEDIAAKQQMYENLVKGTGYMNARLLADTWCAAFVWKKDDTDLGRLCPTDRDFRDVEDNPHSINVHVKTEVQRLSHQYHFFHWHLAFPDVFRLPKDDKNPENKQMGWDGGFDVVLGNPPWERTFIQEKEFFAERAPEIAQATGKRRKRLIADIEDSDPRLFSGWSEYRRHQEGEKELMRGTGAYPLSTLNKFNIYAVFVERDMHLLATDGRMGLVVPSGIASDHMTRLLFDFLVQKARLLSLYDFENREGLFPIHRGFKFCLVVASGSKRDTAPLFGFNLCHVRDLTEKDKLFHLSPEEIRLLNPETGNCPVFSSTTDAVLNIYIYRRMIPFGDASHSGNCWKADAKVMFNMTNDSDLFVSAREFLHVNLTRSRTILQPPSGVPLVRLVESKMIHQYDHRYAAIEVHDENLYRKGVSQPLSVTHHQDATYIPNPRYYIPEADLCRRISDSKWFVIYRGVTDARTNARTGMFTVIGREAVGHTSTVVDLAESHDGREVSSLLSCWNSFALDYTLRQKVGGVHFGAFILRQLPVIPITCLSETAPHDSTLVLQDWLSIRVLELVYSALDLEAFALDCGYDGPPFCWDEERRFLIRCELDAAYFHLYLGSPNEWGNCSPQLCEMFPTPRDAVDYIMETFPIVKRKDITRTKVKNDSGEITQEGRYITKDAILEIYDDMAEAIRTGKPYQTRLDPPPGPPSDAEGNFIPMAQWDPNSWPKHIHTLKEVTT